MDGQPLSALLAAIATFAIGLSVVLRQRMQRPFKQFVWLCLNLCVWHAANAVYFSYRTSAPHDGLYLVSLFVAVLLPVTSIRFFRAFLPSEPRKMSASRVLYLVAGGFALVIGYAIVRPEYGLHRLNLFTIPLVVYIFVGLALSLYEIHAAWRRTLSRMEKTRLFYLLVGAAVSIAFAAGTFVFPVVGNVLITLYVFFLSQILLRYRLLDLNELLGRMAVLTVFALVLSAIYQLLFLIPSTGAKSYLLLTFVASCVVAVLFEPLRSKIEGEVNRWLFREKYELRRRIDELRLSLANIIDVREAVRAAMQALEESRRVTHSAIYLVDEDGSGYELAGHLGPRPAERVDAAARRPFFERLTALQGGVPLSLEQLEREQAGRPPDKPQDETLDAIARTLDELHAGVCVPILAGEQLLGLLCLKDERLREAYASDEIDLFRALAAQMGITLQNSTLYERMKERDRLAALGEMAAGLAHEIRNPLGAIKGAAQFLSPAPASGAAGAAGGGGGEAEASAVPEESRQFLDIIVEETNRLNKVVSQFLDYARPFRGELAPLDLNDVVRKSAQLLNADPKLEIQVALDESNPRVRGDAEQLRQVFLNLAINAVEAMPEGGKLTISTGVRKVGRRNAPEKFAELRFRDTGPGIPPSVVKNLFIPFFTTKEKGTGLGLPISQRIIENHGGRIEVRSRAGFGSTFTVVLPAIEKEEEEKSVESTPTPHGRWLRMPTTH